MAMSQCGLGAVPVPVPRWLLYRLVDVSETGYRTVVGTWVHPALAGIPVPAVLDSSWLASGEGLRGTRPGVYELVQDLFDQGAPPVVEVLSDHGAWGEKAVELGQRLVEEVIFAGKGLCLAANFAPHLET